MIGGRQTQQPALQEEADALPQKMVHWVAVLQLQLSGPQEPAA